jgi:hypothetical protein
VSNDRILRAIDVASQKEGHVRVPIDLADLRALAHAYVRLLGLSGDELPPDEIQYDEQRPVAGQVCVNHRHSYRVPVDHVHVIGGGVSAWHEHGRNGWLLPQ